jgi:REP element-mobilizing transposase RayT
MDYKKRIFKNIIGGKTLWSDGHFASFIGNVSREAAEYYRRNQDERTLISPWLNIQGFYALFY